MRHDPVASPQDGTPTKQVSDKTRPQNRCGNLWARIRRQDNETPALNALKALRGAPISMGRGEIPVELRPAAVRFFASFMVLMKWHERGLIVQKIQSENKYAPPMRSKKKIGNTTFIVNSFFPQTGNQTIASKLENLIKADIQKQTVT